MRGRELQAFIRKIGPSGVIGLRRYVKWLDIDPYLG